MSHVLTEFLEAGLLLDPLNGDDARFARLERAVEAIAEHLHAHPRELVQAVLAGLDPDIDSDEPSIRLAKRMLQAVWKSVTSVYASEPVGLLRALLLAACAGLADKHARDASILWLTAADTLPLRRLGREQPAIQRMLTAASTRTEEAADSASSEYAGAPDVEDLPAMEVEVDSAPARRVNRAALLDRIAAAAAPQSRKGRLKEANPHWAHSTAEWAYEFTDRMADLIADEIDAATASAHASVVRVSEQQEALIAAVMQHTAQQQRWRKTTGALLSAGRTRDRVRLDTLWWSEALYSDTLRCSYRELEPVLAAVQMALELARIVPSPPPASVGYLLAETVHRLPHASFDHRQSWSGVLDALARTRERLPPGWTAEPIAVPSEGSLSMRDVVVLTLSGQDPTVSLKRARITADHAVALPHLAHAVFRQQLAVRLAVEGA